MRHGPPPSKENLGWLIRFVGMVHENAVYLYEAVKQNFVANKIDKTHADLLEELHHFSDTVSAMAQEKADKWGGRKPPNTLEAEYLSSTAVANTIMADMTQTLSASQPVSIRFVVEPTFNREYIADLSPEDKQAIDQYIHAWLLSRGWARVAGEIKAYNPANEVYDQPVSAEAVANMLKDPKHGFSAYVDRESKKGESKQRYQVQTDVKEVVAALQQEKQQGSKG